MLELNTNVAKAVFELACTSIEMTVCKKRDPISGLLNPKFPNLDVIDKFKLSLIPSGQITAFADEIVEAFRARFRVQAQNQLRKMVARQLRDHLDCVMAMVVEICADESQRPHCRCAARRPSEVLWSVMGSRT